MLFKHDKRCRISMGESIDTVSECTYTMVSDTVSE